MDLLVDANDALIEKLRADYDAKIEDMLSRAKAERELAIAQVSAETKKLLAAKKAKAFALLEKQKNEVLSKARADAQAEINKKKEKTFKEILSALKKKVKMATKKDSASLLRNTLEDVLQDLSGDYDISTWSEMKKYPGSLSEPRVEINAEDFEVSFDCNSILLDDREAIYLDLEGEFDLK